MGRDTGDKRVKVLLITWLLYQSTFMRVGYSVLDVEQFDSMAECRAAKVAVKQSLRNVKADESSIECKVIVKGE